MKKVTVVVPVYNVEKYIRKCLESLVDQDCDFYNVLIINDGSPANEQPIIDEYVEKYSHFSTIVKENGGYGSVLQMAIHHIETPYMLICDPDDYLYPYTVRKLTELMEENQVDLVIGAKTLVFSDNEEEKYDKSYNADYAHIKDNRIYQTVDTEYKDLYFIEPSPHAKLYKTAMLTDIVFPNKVSYTDNLLYFTVLNHARKVIYTSEALAYYLINRAGNTRTDVKLSAIDSWIKVISALLEQNNDETVPDIFYYRMFEAYKTVMNEKIDACRCTEEEYADRLHKLYQIIKLLLPHAEAVKKYYRLYASYGFLEKIRDRELLNAATSEKTYRKLINRKIERRKNGIQG